MFWVLRVLMTDMCGLFALRVFIIYNHSTKRKDISIMLTSAYVKTQIDDLPQSALEKVMDFINFQRYTLGLYDDDTEYLIFIPGMVEKIKEGNKTPLSDCIPMSEAWGDV
jgi:hypothetical protein